MAKENLIYPDKAFQRGLREIKVKDLPEVREAVKDILGVIAVFAIFAGCVEGLDGGPTAWTIICLAVSALTGLVSKKLEGVK